MRTFNLAWRNIFRNRRRSFATMTAIAVGAAGVLLFGGYVVDMILNIQTNMVRGNGHLHVYKTGYFAEGSADPTAYSFGHYPDVMAAIQQDDYLAPRMAVMTPFQRLSGIVGNFKEESSITFLAKGVVPEDREAMKVWNPYGIKMPPGSGEEPALDDADHEVGLIGRGMAQNLSLCQDLGLTDCPQQQEEPIPKEETAFVDEGLGDLGFLAELEAPDESTALPEGTVMLDLMAATTGGAPNVVGMKVRDTADFGERNLDRHFLLMHLDLAQSLLYGSGGKKVTGLVLQLQKTNQMTKAREHLENLIREQGWDLEVKSFTDYEPLYLQILSLFGTIFGFISIIMGAIVLFTIVNTMRMSVMERVTEIGTLRSMGLRQNGILQLFLWEGTLLGVLGASAGVLLAFALAVVFNNAGLSWVPPMRVTPVYLVISIFEDARLVPFTWLGLVAASVVSSLIPAKAAARMAVVDALRHN